ncbi:nucleotide-binding protein [Flaviramulus sp. BrNp1-15]|uniref:TIR domain-containing protein n=1 Tax=Flaviramulus sp. BrNp1-15 TaxID=2916754 RepID=UPI001EE82833|nr:nucleotide-binding protein [Flaviramulus sp. BrNp1-15]ULC60539.1 nucleotide-binding protein [Flaviramulus sp. BrNp1-15]
MELVKKYKRTVFKSHRLKEIFDFWKSSINNIDEDAVAIRLIENNTESWNYDTDEEFLSDYDNEKSYATYSKSFYLKRSKNELLQSVSLKITLFENSETHVYIKDNDRIRILKIKNFIEENISDYEILKPKVKSPEILKPVVFIGHGGSSDWRDLKDHLNDKHGIEVIAYETGARAGHTIRDILDEMMENSSFAILVMTSSDEQVDGTMNARPNVIHEVGLFQGKLGFNKAIVALEKGTNLFSNLDGIQQLRFSPGNIKEIFGDVLATIKREF